jgi:hypothetical protein
MKGLKMKEKSNWTKFKGINGKLIAIQLGHIVAIEDADVGGNPICILKNTYGFSVNVEATIDEVINLIEKDENETIERSLDFWKEREEKRIERAKEEHE